MKAPSTIRFTLKRIRNRPQVLLALASIGVCLMVAGLIAPATFELTTKSFGHGWSDDSFQDGWEAFGSTRLMWQTDGDIVVLTENATAGTVCSSGLSKMLVVNTDDYPYFVFKVKCSSITDSNWLVDVRYTEGTGEYWTGDTEHWVTVVRNLTAGKIVKSVDIRIENNRGNVWSGEGIISAYYDFVMFCKWRLVPFNPFTSPFRATIFVAGVILTIFGLETHARQVRSEKEEILLLFILLLLLFVLGINEAWLGPDEITWMTLSSEQMTNPSADPREGPITQYIIGIALWLAGYREVTRLIADSLIPNDPGILVVARMPGAIFSALACIVIFLLGCELGGRKTGLFACLFLAFNPLWLMLSQQTGSDTTSVFFSTLSLILFYYGTKSTKDIVNKKRAYWFFIFAGMAIGLALGTKQSAALTSIAIVSYFCVECLIRFKRREKISMLLIGFLITMLIGTITLIGSDQYFYSDTYKRLTDDYIFRVWVEGGVASGWWERYRWQQELGVANWLSGFVVVIHRVLYPVIVAKTEANVWVAGLSLSEPFGRFGLEPRLGDRNLASYCTILWSAFFITGLIHLTFNTLKPIGKSQLITSSSHIDVKGLILLWFAASFLGISSLICVNWERYVFPILPPMSIVVGHGFNTFLERVDFRSLRVRFMAVAIVVLNACSVLVLFPNYAYNGFQIIMKSSIGLLLTLMYIFLIFCIVSMHIMKKKSSWDATIKILCNKTSSTHNNLLFSYIESP